MRWLKDALKPLREALDQWLDRARLRFLCLGLLMFSLVLCVLSFATSDRGTTRFGPPLGADFAGFYNAGFILNLPEPERDRLYDFEFQDQLYHELLPNLPREKVNPFVHPPFVAAVFRLLARLPYEVSFAVWLVICACLYVSGFLVAWKSLRNLPEGYRLDALLLALTFEPFLMECCLGGQLSAVMFCCFALALYFEQAERPFLSGLALGLVLYKPNLLVLVLPMLVVARRWRTLAGFSLTALGLAGFSIVAAGWNVCLSYLPALRGFTQTTTGTGLKREDWKWVDLNFFFRFLLDSYSPLNGVLVLAIAALPLALLVLAWWRLDRFGDDHRRLVWAATLTWTLVINVYMSIYDTLLVVLSSLWTADVLVRRDGVGKTSLPPALRDLLVLLFVAGWVYGPLARVTRFQGFTLVLMAVASYQLFQARRLAASGGREPLTRLISETGP